MHNLYTIQKFNYISQNDLQHLLMYNDQNATANIYMSATKITDEVTPTLYQI